MKYDFLDTDVLARLKAIPMESRFPMIGNVAGRHRSPHRGSSVEFAEYRKYVPGDDTRRLDWKAYARSDRYYIKEFEADTNLRAYFVVDSSGSMGFSSGENPSKMEFARRIAATLSYLIVNQGDSAGLSCCNEKLHLEIPPSRRPAQLQHIFESLASVEPKGETGLIEALHTVAEKIQQRALVIVLSDFFVESDELAAALQHLRFRKHDIAMFHLLDPQEVAFHFERPHRFVDLEEGTAVVAEPNLIVDEYHAALNEFLEATEKGSYDVNADYQLLQTDANIEEVVSNFVTGRLTKKS
ncbi:DUF58 domain-containing protein [Akkermansiaceae bacterium]|nr:DUF58 domain-containing protein [Akkermansiaceae bacterium]MDB4287199.1 DUF58 domain-containing protein [bacterium]MDB4258350.1 DUF58 domain-containing protein [Akkermansiaceae bacterium]MDB4274166.1 DUF58 domain-containing protein [Akkermansiaceae bacterium]MDB4276028.1 DUF58 domain-containing protein [Akkermansiaceae bacterium]